jgi:hypothetical protein
LENTLRLSKAGLNTIVLKEIEPGFWAWLEGGKHILQKLK